MGRLAVAVVLAFPGMVRAEGLGPGAYDGLVEFLMGIALAGLVAVGFLIWFAISSVRKAKARRNILATTQLKDRD